jgi:hypothetical protein
MEIGWEGWRNISFSNAPHSKIFCEEKHPPEPSISLIDINCSWKEGQPGSVPFSISFIERGIDVDYSIFQVVFASIISEVPSIANIWSFHSFILVWCQSISPEILQIACFRPQCFNCYVPGTLYNQFHCVPIADAWLIIGEKVENGAKRRKIAHLSFVHICADITAFTLAPTRNYSSTKYDGALSSASG